MGLPAVEAAKRFVNDKYPNCFTAILAGSASRGEETETSDLDIVIFDNTVVQRFRESLIEYGWRIESFIHNESSYLEQFNVDRQSGRATLATMISTGKILKDNGMAARLIENAEKCIREGPPPLSEEFINASRYFIYDLLDDFRDSSNDAEAVITVNTLSIQLVEFILRLNGQWSGRGKGLTRQLYRFDGRLADTLFESLHAFYRRGEKQPLIDFVNLIYQPLGGQLFDGFRQIQLAPDLPGRTSALAILRILVVACGWNCSW